MRSDRIERTGTWPGCTERTISVVIFCISTRSAPAANRAGSSRGSCRDVDQACWGLVQDLKAKGLFDSTLIIWGDRDELLTREEEEHLATLIPGSRLVVYQDTGHLVLWEQPERVARDVTTFVESLQD